VGCDKYGIIVDEQRIVDALRELKKHKKEYPVMSYDFAHLYHR
jgi:hypothetical protein